MPTVQPKYKPIVLAVLDGWGLSPSWGGNAISMNNPETINFLWRSYPHKVLQAFSPIVNPGGKVGNSEIGHSCIGGGRLVKQDSARITEAINDKTFFANPVLKKVIAEVKQNSKKLHIIALVSDGWVHSHISHLKALVNMAKQEGLPDVYIHAITDGIDTPPSSGVQFIAYLTQFLQEIGYGKIATICGRHYVMDRDNHWDRTAAAYQAYTQGIGRMTEMPAHAVSSAYSEGFNDDKVPPTIITTNGQPTAKISDGDGVIFANFRADRMKQIVSAFIDPQAFKKTISGRQYPLTKILPVTLTSYRINLPVEVAFPYIYQKNNLTEVLSINGFKQIHFAESEKQAHVTYFFDGGNEQSTPGEHYVIVPSPNVDDYSKTPEMSSKQLTRQLIGHMNDAEFSLINYSNVDMIGHTGNIMAAAEAVKVVDECVKELYENVIKQGGALIITADHGNAEQMIKLSSEVDPESTHTLNPVPFIMITPENKKAIDSGGPGDDMLRQIIESKNTLADIAPTVLELCGIAKPVEMTGNSLASILE